ncbi:uncharacterized protein LOC125520159 isoform X2 [Triticum urartu]|uniref:uncharacterized protein LOC125520159 isoform X2 n=1 Tax=Triticum urartu TaxID=4572 RepID=UPI0020432CF9|nr:uncharacterized protein LOC125520159 isoform X2 [Triticum urartu]
MNKLDAVFSCPFCNHGSSIECRIDMHNLIGEATCQICQESFSITANDCTFVRPPSSPHHRAPPPVCSRIHIEEDDENLGHATILSPSSSLCSFSCPDRRSFSPQGTSTLQSRCASPLVLSYRHLAKRELHGASHIRTEEDDENLGHAAILSPSSSRCSFSCPDCQRASPLGTSTLQLCASPLVLSYRHLATGTRSQHVEGYFQTSSSSIFIFILLFLMHFSTV